MKVLIFGCGVSGLEIGRRLAGRGVEVAGTTRSADKHAKLEQAGIKPLPFDGQKPGPELLAEMKDVTHLVISIAPPRQESEDRGDVPVDPVLAALAALGGKLDSLPKLTWIGYLSTVGVYGNHDGEWMDETAELSPTSARSRQRVRAEKEWQAAAEAMDTPVTKEKTVLPRTVAIARRAGIFFRPRLMAT